jgi:hypothetical protein
LLASAFVCCAAICSIILIPVSFESLSPCPRSIYTLTNSCGVQSWPPVSDCTYGT